MDIRNARSKFGEALQQAAVGEHGTLLNPSNVPRNDAAGSVNQGLVPSRGGRRARLLAAKALERPGVIRLYERRIDLAQFMHDESPSLYELVRVWLTDVGQITQSASECVDENSASLASVSDPLFACVKQFTPRHVNSPKRPKIARLESVQANEEGMDTEMKEEVNPDVKPADIEQPQVQEAQQGEQPTQQVEVNQAGSASGDELQIGEGGDADQMLARLLGHLTHWKEVRSKHKQSYSEFVESNYENFRAIDECAARKRSNN